MPTVIRRTETVTLTERRKDVARTVGWQVTSSVWSPPTDVYETEHEYIIRVEVAGISESDLEITYQDGILVVRGVRPELPERRAYYRMELHYGKFSTVVGIPGPVDLDKSLAEYKDGFLTVKMPKGKPTEVEIEE